MDSQQPIRIGTSGYSYEDWRGVLYPEDLPKTSFLAYYALFFPFVELNFSYYTMPVRKNLKAMAERTPHDFRFSIKTHRSLTHEIQPDWEASARQYRSAVEVLAELDRLVCVLVQLPYSFHHTPDNRVYLARLLDALQGLPLAVEFRNDEWQGERVRETLANKQVATVLVDQPELPGLAGRTEQTTADFSYYRFHGRNAGAWWQGDNVSRYDYLYSDEELALVQGPLRRLARNATVWVAFNNHAGGKAVRNARKLQELLSL